MNSIVIKSSNKIINKRKINLRRDKDIVKLEIDLSRDSNKKDNSRIILKIDIKNSNNTKLL